MKRSSDKDWAALNEYLGKLHAGEYDFAMHICALLDSAVRMYRTSKSSHMSRKNFLYHCSESWNAVKKEEIGNTRQF